MSQTTYQRVQQACNQQEALFAIATALDEIKAALAQPHQTDAWGSQLQPWISAPAALHALVEPEVGSRPVQSGELAIEALRVKLAETTDGEDRRALEAQLRLLTDGRKPGPVESGEGRAVQNDHADGTDIDLTPVTPERQIARIQWAARVELEQYLIPVEDEWTPAQAQAAFAKGGPMWLYLGNRIAVLQLPVGERQWLVHECARDSQADAHELARDILKADESVDPSVTLEAIDAMSGTH